MSTLNKPLIEYGWVRAVLFIVLSLALVTAIQVAISLSRGQMTGSDENSLVRLATGFSVVALVLVGLAFLFRRFIDRRTIVSMGFTWRGFRSHGASGFFLGVLMLAAGALFLVMTGRLFFTGVSWDPQGMITALVLFTVVAFTEEIAFRGYILNNLMESTNKWAALGMSALVFALFHSMNQNITVLAMLNIFLAGILLGLNYIFTKNLWFAIFLHFSWNFFQGPVLGFEVSGIPISGLMDQTLKGPDYLTGGAFGFEGSIVCLVLLALTCALLGSYYAGYRTRELPEFKH